MDYISIQVPASVYVGVYQLYGEGTGQAIATALQKLVSESPGAQRSTRPKDGTITGRIWEIADNLLATTGSASRVDVVTQCIDEELNMNTASTQYSHWKKEQK